MKTKRVKVILAIAWQRDKSGTCYSQEALEQMAATTPGLHMEGDALVGEYEIVVLEEDPDS